MKREYRVIAFKEPELVSHETFEADTQNNAISQMVDYLLDQDFTLEQIQLFEFVCCPADFNALKQIDKEGNVEKVDQ